MRKRVIGMLVLGALVGLFAGPLRELLEKIWEKLFSRKPDPGPTFDRPARAAAPSGREASGRDQGVGQSDWERPAAPATE